MYGQATESRWVIHTYIILLCYIILHSKLYFRYNELNFRDSKSYELLKSGSDDIVFYPKRITYLIVV